MKECRNFVFYYVCAVSDSGGREYVMKRIFLSLLVCMLTMACTAVSCWAEDNRSELAQEVFRSAEQPELAPFIGRWQVLKSAPTVDEDSGRVHEIGVGTVIDIKPDKDGVGGYTLNGVVVTPSANSEFAAGDSFCYIYYHGRLYESDLAFNPSVLKENYIYAGVEHRRPIDNESSESYGGNFGGLYAYIEGDTIIFMEALDDNGDGKETTRPIRGRAQNVHWMLKKI